MPRVFRSMKKDADGFPTVEQSVKGLGVRPGVDIRTDTHGNVVLDGSGMSVVPDWRVLPHFRIPKRLKREVAHATGPDTLYCFALGSGPFQSGSLAPGLVLAPDSPTHGTVAPAAAVPLAQYQADLAATRGDWFIDEGSP